MSMSKHRHICIFRCPLFHGFHQFLHFRNQHIFHGILEHHGICRGIDVFTRTPNVNQRLEIALAHFIELFAQEVFHGLYVVVRSGLNLLDTNKVVIIEAFANALKILFNEFFIKQFRIIPEDFSREVLQARGILPQLDIS